MAYTAETYTTVSETEIHVTGTVYSDGDVDHIEIRDADGARLPANFESLLTARDWDIITDSLRDTW